MGLGNVDIHWLVVLLVAKRKRVPLLFLVEVGLIVSAVEVCRGFGGVFLVLGGVGLLGAVLLGLGLGTVVIRFTFCCMASRKGVLRLSFGSVVLEVGFDSMVTLKGVFRLSLDSMVTLKAVFRLDFDPMLAFKGVVGFALSLVMVLWDLVCMEAAYGSLLVAREAVAGGAAGVVVSARQGVVRLQVCGGGGHGSHQQAREENLRRERRCTDWGAVDTQSAVT